VWKCHNKGPRNTTELKIAYMCLKEETIECREKVSEKTTQILNIQKDLDKSKVELQNKVYVVLFFGEQLCPSLFVESEQMNI
jgi:hypothetical protein